MDIKNLFKSVLSKFKKDNAESAGQKLDEGKNINLNMRSERYTYGDADGSGYLGNAKSLKTVTGSRQQNLRNRHFLLKAITEQAKEQNRKTAD